MRVMGEMRTAVIGAMVVMLGPISLSMYLPAMPTLVGAFDTTVPVVKLSLTVFFLGFAFSQLVCGPLSDAYGRRPVALGFFAVFLVGSVVALFAPAMDWLIVGRALQGIGCAAGIAISRAIVRDQFTGQASARIMNLIGTMLAIGPSISPTLGGLIMSHFGWHAIFAAMALYGVVLFVLFALLVPETNRAPDPRLAAPGPMLASYGELLGDRTFLRAALVLGITLGGIYTISALTPFILMERVGLTPTQFGLAMLMQTGSFMVGTLVTARMLKRMDASRVIPYGLALTLAAGVAMAVGLRVLPINAFTVMIPVGLWAFSMALVMPGTTTSALAGFAHIAGAAAAMTGFMQIGGGFLGSAVAALFPDPLTAMATLLPAFAALAVAIHVLLRPARGTQALKPAVPVDPVDLEVAADPAGLVGAAGDEIEAGVYRKRA